MVLPFVLCLVKASLKIRCFKACKTQCRRIGFSDICICATNAGPLQRVSTVLPSLGSFLARCLLMRIALPIITDGFLASYFFGQQLPSPLSYGGCDCGLVVDHVAYGTEAIYRIP